MQLRFVFPWRRVMSDLFKSVTAAYTQEHPGVKILSNFSSSGALAKQIDQGAPTDIYVSANPKWMEYLDEKGRIVTGTKRIFAHNSLVFVGKPGVTVHSMTDLQKLLRIALASPSSAPAGQYARQALTKAGLYEDLLQAGKLAMAKDVRQALMYADRGETDGAFVYRPMPCLRSMLRSFSRCPRNSTVWFLILLPLRLWVKRMRR